MVDTIATRDLVACLFSNFVDVLTGHNGCIYHDDHEALEELHLVAQALGQTLTVQVIERHEPYKSA